MPVEGASARIDAAIRRWPGVSPQPHRFGGTEYLLGEREIGHVHGDHLVDTPYPKGIRDRLVADGRVEASHMIPQSGWVSLYLKGPNDVERAIEMLRLSYDLATGKTSQ